MQSVSFVLSVEEAKALLQMTQNQLFRLKFLDPKMPGYKPRPGELEASESAAKVLEAALNNTGKNNDGGWNSPVGRGTIHRLP
jgi:hypothetical protein